MNLCYYQPVYNEDSDDVENEIIKLSIMHEQIDEENPVPPVIDSNDTSSEDTKCTKCKLNGITEEELRKISASADGGPRFRVFARETLHSAPHRY